MPEQIRNDLSETQLTRVRAPKDWRRLHLWQIQLVRDALVLGAVAGLIWLGYRLSIVTVPLLLALLLAYLSEPLVRLLARRRYMTRTGAALSIIAAAGLIIVVPVGFGLSFAVLEGISFTRQIVSNAQKLQKSVESPADEVLFESLPPGGWRTIRNYIVEAREESGDFGPLVPEPTGGEGDAQAAPADPDEPEQRPRPHTQQPSAPPGEIDREEEERHLPVVSRARDIVRETTAWLFHVMQANAESIGRFVGRQALGTGADAARAAIGAATSVGYVLFTGFLTAFFFFFFCTGYGRVLSFWEGLIPERRKARVFDLLEQMDGVIAAFVRGRLTICAILMGYFSIAYWLVGVPAPLLLGPAVGLLSLLPYVAGIGMPVAMLLMWLQPEQGGWQGEWWWIVGGPILVTIGAQLLDDYVLTPTIQGKKTGMDTPSIVFASIAGGALGGVYGLLLAIPVAACIKILLREVVMPRVHMWAEGKTPDFLPIED